MKVVNMKFLNYPSVKMLGMLAGFFLVFGMLGGSAFADAEPYFNIDEVTTNEPVPETQDMELYTTITNIGDIEDTQTIDLYHEGTHVSQYSDLYLDVDQTETITLVWEAEHITPQVYDMTVKTDQDEYNITVEVVEADKPQISTLPAENITEEDADLMVDVETMGDYSELTSDFVNKQNMMRVGEEDIHTDPQEYEGGMSPFIGRKEDYIYYVITDTNHYEGSDLIRYDIETGQHEVLHEMFRPQHGFVEEDGVLWMGGFGFDHPDGIGHIMGYDTETEEEIFYEVFDEWIPVVLVEDGILYYYESDVNTTAYDLEGEQMLWTTDEYRLRFGEIYDGMLLGTQSETDEDDNLIDLNLTLRNASTGEEIWTESYHPDPLSHAPMNTKMHDGYGYVTTETDVVKFDLDTGSYEWHKGINQSEVWRSEIAVEDGYLTLQPLEDSWVYALDITDPENQFRYSPENEPDRYFTYENELYFLNEETGEIVVIDSSNWEKQTKTVTESGIYSVEVTGLESNTEHEYYVSGTTEDDTNVFGGYETYLTTEYEYYEIDYEYYTGEEECVEKPVLDGVSALLFDQIPTFYLLGLIFAGISFALKSVDRL